MDWIKAHPYLAGSGILAAIVFLIVFKKSSSSSSPVVVSSGTDPATAQANLAAGVQLATLDAQQNASTNQLNASLQSQVLAQQSTGQQTAAAAQAQNAEVAAAEAVGLAQAQAGVSEEEAQTGAGVQTTQLTTAAQTQQVAAQLAAALSLGGTQAQVTNAQTAAALEAEQLQNAAAEAINSQNAGVTNQQTQAGTQVSLATLADYLTGLQDNNSTALTANSTQLANNLQLANVNNSEESSLAALIAGVTNNQTQANETIASQGNAAELQALAEEIAAQEQQQNTVVSYQTGLNANVLSAAQKLGPNNYAATLAALLGSPSLGTTEIQGQPGSASSPASIIASIGNLFAGLGTGVGRAATGILG